MSETGIVITIILAIVGVAGLVYFAQLVRFRTGLSRLRPGQSGEKPSVAVVIAARNEEDEIGACLEGLSLQDYPGEKFQVVVVDDGSTDRTPDIVREASLKNPGIRLIRVEEPPPGIAPKKYAVTRGIEETDSEIIILTDADSRSGPSWISGMVRHFTPEVGMVLGYTGYRREEGVSPWFLGLQSLDFLSHAFVAAGAVGAGQAFNSNANNLAFRRKTYMDTGGYGAYSRYISGDDDLLLQTVVKQTRWRIDFAIEPETFVTTRPASGIREAFRQRMRWASKSTAYNRPVLLFLISTFIFFTGLLLLIPYSFLSSLSVVFPLLLFGLKVVFDYLVMKKGHKTFGLEEQWRYFPLTELFHIPYILTIAVGGQLLPHEWRGRKSGRKVD